MVRLLFPTATELLEESAGFLAGRRVPEVAALGILLGFKPTATISSAQQTVDTEGNAVTLEAQGRHDPCVLPRAVPMVEAMMCLVLADHWLRQRAVNVL